MTSQATEKTEIQSQVPKETSQLSEASNITIIEELKTTPKPISLKPSRASILIQKTNENDHTTKSIERKRKTVRFVDKTEFFDDNDSVRENEKGHFLVREILKAKKQDVNSPTTLREISQTPASSSIQFESPGTLLKSSLKSKRSDELDEIAYSLTSSNSNSNDTIVFDDVDDTLTKTTLNNTKSFYEFDSILFPKTSKFVDYLSLTTQDGNTIIEEREDSLPSQKEAKKEKKIIQADQIKSSASGNSTSSLTLMSMELHVNTRGKKLLSFLG